MMTPSVMFLQERQVKRLLQDAIAISVDILAVAIACLLHLLRDITIPVYLPILLIIGALIVMLPLKHESIGMLQSIMCLYLVCVPISQLAQQYMTFSLLSMNINISLSVPIFVLFLLERLFGFNRSSILCRSKTNKIKLYRVWLFALGIIVFHMGLLALMLNRFYGFGYEQDWKVLGNLVLYFLIFVLLWDRVSQMRPRQYFGFLLALYYGVLTYVTI